MSTGGFSKARLDQLRDVMTGYVQRAELPGLTWLVSRRGETEIGFIRARPPAARNYRKGTGRVGAAPVEWTFFAQGESHA